MLRQARAEDIAAIQRIRMSVRENRLVSRVIADADVLEAIEDLGRGWVVESGGEVVAFAIGNASDGNIWALFVDPEHEGRGYGRQLHDAMIDWLWSQGLDSLWLTTEPGTRAQRFYETAGWNCAGATERGELRFELHRESRYRLRKAAAADQAALEDLIARSARELSAGDYTAQQIEGALRGAFGVDTQLIRDGTYFVAEAQGQIVGCGGWSRRRTLFGGDANAQRDAAELDPRVDAAKIRAFFVAPEHARQGIGRSILERCESDARAHGFSRFELMATLPGMRLYATFGYRPETPVRHPLGPGLAIELVPMSKTV